MGPLLSCHFVANVHVDEVINTLLSMKLERYQISKEEYYSLRRTGISDNEMEKRFVSGIKIK